MRTAHFGSRIAGAAPLAMLLVLSQSCQAAGAGAVGTDQPAKTIVFLGGVKTHGPGAHEHLKGVQLLKNCLEAAANVPRLKTQIYLDAWPKDPAELDGAATIVLMWEGWESHLVSRRNAENVQKLEVPAGGVQSTLPETETPRGQR